jgi:hypothetical protein
LAILTQLCTRKNAESILKELHEYARDIDDQIAREAIRNIGKIATRVDVAADRTIKALMNIIKQEMIQPHILNEVAVTLADILRKYPKKFQVDHCVKFIVGKIDMISEPKSMAAMVWMLGEYSQYVTNSGEAFTELAKTFRDLDRIVQQQMLTCAVKMFLRDPDTMEDAIQDILEIATEEISNPDIRDRGYIYYRLLSEYPDETKEIVLSDKPQLKSRRFQFERKLVENLVNHVSMVSSVYHKTHNQLFDKINYSRTMEKQGSSKPSKKTKGGKGGRGKEQKQKEEEEEEVDSGVEEGDEDVEEKGEDGEDDGGMMDLIGMDDDGEDGGMDLFDEGSGAPEEEANGPKRVPMETFLEASDKGKKGSSGVEVRAAFRLNAEQQIELHLQIHNQSGQDLSSFKFQMKPNYFAVDLQKVAGLSVGSGQTETLVVPTKVAKRRSQKVPDEAPLKFTIGMKTSADVFFFDVDCMFHVLLLADVDIGKSEFKKTWKQMGLDSETGMTLEMGK